MSLSLQLLLGSTGKGKTLGSQGKARLRRAVRQVVWLSAAASTQCQAAPGTESSFLSFSEKWNARITDLRKQVEELFERKYGMSAESPAQPIAQVGQELCLPHTSVSSKDILAT